MKRTDAKSPRKSGSQLGAAVPAAATPVVTPGDVLWTMTKGDGTAEARRWVSPNGLELELQIWTGPRVRGKEDLSWVQIFPTQELLEAMALAKKRQLEGAGWVEQLEVFGV
jgi:hypothetical protein